MTDWIEELSISVHAPDGETALAQINAARLAALEADDYSGSADCRTGWKARWRNFRAVWFYRWTYWSLGIFWWWYDLKARFRRTDETTS